MECRFWDLRLSLMGKFYLIFLWVQFNPKNRDKAVSMVTRLWARQFGVRFSAGAKDFSKSPKSALGSTQPRIQRVMGGGWFIPLSTAAGVVVD